MLATGRNAVKIRLVNTSTTQTNAARDAGHPLMRLRHHVTGAIERGDAIAIVERPAASNYNRARAICSCRHHAFPCEKCETLKDTAAGARHTPEPWHHSADLPHHGCRLIHAADGYLVADAGRITRRTGDEMDSNAARIVACVNACKGMNDPAAEIAALRGMLADAAVQLARLTGPALETYARTFAALAGKGDK